MTLTLQVLTLSVSSDLAEVLAESGLQQHVDAPTRYNPEHLLDVIATDPKLIVRDVRVHDAGLISDHRLVLATLVADSVKRNPPTDTQCRPCGFRAETAKLAIVSCS